MNAFVFFLISCAIAQHGFNLGPSGGTGPNPTPAPSPWFSGSDSNNPTPAPWTSGTSGWNNPTPAPWTSGTSGWNNPTPAPWFSGSSGWNPTPDPWFSGSTGWNNPTPAPWTSGTSGWNTPSPSGSSWWSTNTAGTTGPSGTWWATFGTSGPSGTWTSDSPTDAPSGPFNADTLCVDTSRIDPMFGMRCNYFIGTVRTFSKFLGNGAATFGGDEGSDVGIAVVFSSPYMTSQPTWNATVTSVLFDDRGVTALQKWTVAFVLKGYNNLAHGSFGDILATHEGIVGYYELPDNNPGNAFEATVRGKTMGAFVKSTRDSIKEIVTFERGGKSDSATIAMNRVTSGSFKKVFKNTGTKKSNSKVLKSVFGLIPF